MATVDKGDGLDVHKYTTVLTVAVEAHAGEVRLCGTILSEMHALEKAFRRIGNAGGT